MIIDYDNDDNEAAKDEDFGNNINYNNNGAVSER
jgi:hypothetical protein